MTQLSITQTLPSTTLVHPEIIRMERFVHLIFSLHAILTMLYNQSMETSEILIWLVLDVVFVSSMWLLIRRDKERHFVSFRAVYLAAFVWMTTVLLGGASTFFLFWGLAINVIYAPMLSRNQALALMFGIPISYVLAYPLLPTTTSFPVILIRAVTMLFAGWIAYRINAGILKGLMEREELRTQLTKAQLESQQLEKEKELYLQKMQFIAVVSHEFRTPMAIIEMAGYMLENYFERMPADKRSERINEIRSQTSRLADMLNSIVTAEQLFTFPTQTTLSPVNLRQHCDAVVAEMCTLDTQNHRIITAYEGDLDHVMIDSERLNVILYNLLSNAIKYSPEGSDIAVGLRRDKEIVTLQVTDHGMGIQEEDGPYLFQPFYRGEKATFIKGIGLGLALVYEGVQQQGGSIDWSSVDEQGTTFTVSLPVKCVA